MAGGQWTAPEGRCAVAVAARPRRPGHRTSSLQREGSMMSRNTGSGPSDAGQLDAAPSASSDDAAASLNSVEVRAGGSASVPPDTPEGEKGSATNAAPDQEAVAADLPVDLAGLDAAG